MLLVDQADAAGDHDRFVVAAVAAGEDVFGGAEDAENIGSAELVAKGRPADRSLGHDFERCGQACGEFGVVLFPGLREVGQAQMRGKKGAQSGLRPAAGAGRPLVADLAAYTGGGTGVGRDGGRVVMGFDLDQYVGLLVAIGVAVVLVELWTEDWCGETLNDAGVVGIGFDRALRVNGVRVADHIEERAGLALAVDNPVGVENLVAAMLRVDDGEHHQLYVGWVTI